MFRRALRHFFKLRKLRAGINSIPQRPTSAILPNWIKSVEVFKVMKKRSATRIVDERTKYSTKSGCRRMHSGPAINRCCSARPGYQFACCYRPATSYTCLFLKIRTVSSAEFPVSVCGRNSLLEATKKIKPFVFCFVLYFEEKLSHLKWKWILYFPLVGPYMEAKNWDGTVVRFHWNFIHFNWI